jgi:N-carbamoyl-L-amino-acid hydrolase
MKQIKINSTRLISSIYEIARIGKLSNGGVRRLAFSKNDLIAKKKIIEWCEELGLNLGIDSIGNIFARLENNKNFTKKSTGIGSHLDTQPHGGKFDGAYGVLAGLEVIRTIVEKKIILKRPIELIIWSNEEGCRYTPPLMGSLFFTNSVKLKNLKKLKDSEGILLEDELIFFHNLGLKKVLNKKIDSFIEIHIEQGPILEKLKKSIGVVIGAQGSRGLNVDFVGEDSHSGTTPMNVRKDTVVALSNFVVDFTNEAKKLHKDLRATVGSIVTLPGSRNTVSGKSSITVDIRHKDPNILNKIEKIIANIGRKIELRLKVHVKIKKKYILPTVNFDNKIISIIKQACNELKYSSKRMLSGAGHDAVSLSKVVPTGMIFIPCRKGISHSEKEFASRKDMIAGCNVLLKAVLKIDKK